MRCDYSFKSPVWETISDDAKAFVSSLIVMDPKKRLDAKQALEHDWFSLEEMLSMREPSEDLLKGIEAGLHNYANVSDLKKIALNVSACPREMCDLFVIDSLCLYDTKSIYSLSAGDCPQIKFRRDCRATGSIRTLRH
jgi:serine/threonine protein kinase